ncbi:MAG: FHA domain-containing protein, partial [Planctomycetes bacterium]|nr:FHA domain-containing protein [Planctomycetota bacterium]
MKAELVLKSAERQETYPLTGERTTIGRSIHAQIRLMDKLASREHCEIARMGDRFVLRDLGSANGTIVNGHAVAERILEWGDKIQVGESVLVFFFERPEPGEDSDVGVTNPGVPDAMSRFLRITDVDLRSAAAGAGAGELSRLLYDAALELLPKGSVGEVCGALPRALVRGGRFGRAAVVLFDEQGEVTERFIRAGGDAPRHRIQLEAGALRRVFQERESFHRRGETVEEMTYSSA